MIDRIIHFSIHNKLIIGIGILGLVIWGIYSLAHLSIDAVPDITDNQVQVITSSPNLSTQEIERQVTYPIELELGNIPEIEEIRSISRMGLSIITIVFKENVDIYWARQLISEKLQIAKEKIPEEYGFPEMGPISTGLGEIYQYVLYPADGYEDQYDGYELRTIQDWIVKRQLTGVPGVVEINSSGGYLKQYEIQINSAQMRAYDVTLDELLEAVKKNNSNTGGAYVEARNQAFFIRGEGMLKSIEDIGNIVIKRTESIPILIKNIATIKIGHAARYGAVTMLDKGEVVAGQVMMLKGENSPEVLKRVKSRIEEIKSSLPEGVVLEPYLDRSKLVNQTTRTVSKNLIEGALIVIFILVLLLGNLRAGLIVASVIPLSMLFAVSMMRIFGVSANLMSLGALDFGLIVDGAVIIIEAILYHLGIINLKKNLTKSETDLEIFSATTRIRKSAAFGEIIILIVYLPILFLQGMEGKMFRPMAQTVGFAIFGALILSLTYVPMMASLILKNVKENPRSIGHRFMEFLKRFYLPALEKALRYKYILLIATVLLFGLSIWQASRMGGEFIPTLEEGDFALHQILPTGSSLQKGIDISGDLQKILKDNFPEVQTVVTKIGTAEIPTDIMPLEAGDIFVIMKPMSEWTSASTRAEMFEKMNEKLREFPGVMYEFTQPIQMRFNELMTGIRQDIAIKIYGEDLGILTALAATANGLINQVDGVGEIRLEATEGQKSLVVTHNRVKLAKYGLNVKDVNNVLATAYAGQKAGMIYEGDRSFKLVVRLREEERNNLDNIYELAIPLEEGGFIPLSEVAKIEYKSGPAQISRDNTKRRITLGINTRNRDIASVIKDIKTVFNSQLELPVGYYVTYGGQFENFEKARDRLFVIVPIALALIFLLLYFTFNSAVYALLIFTAIPMSSIGGIWALQFRDMPLSISAGVGFIALFGVAVLNGIVLIGYFNQLKKEGMTDTRAILIRGASVRLRPVIMTALVASLGFLPMAISHSAGAEVQRPLATVVIGGLISATLLTLFILPILYELVGKWKSSKNLLAISLLIMASIFCNSSISGQQLSLKDGLKNLENSPVLINYRMASRSALMAQVNNPIYATPWSFSFNAEELNGSKNQGIQQFQFQKYIRLNKVGNLVKSSLEIDQKLLDNQVDLQLLDLKKEYIQDYIYAAYCRSMISLSQAETSAYEKRLEQQNQLLNAGAIGIHMVLPYEIKLNQAQNKSSLWESNYQAELKVLRQYDNNELIDVFSIEDIPLEEYNPILAYPQLAKYDLMTESNASQAKIAQSQLAPQLITGLQLQRLNGSIPFFGFTIGTQVYLDKKYISSIDNRYQLESDALVQAKRIQSNQLERKLNGQIRELESAKNRMDFLRNDQLIKINNYTKTLDQAYSLGEASITDLVLGQQMYFDHKYEYLSTLKNYLIALYQIKVYE